MLFFLISLSSFLLLLLITNPLPSWVHEMILVCLLLLQELLSSLWHSLFRTQFLICSPKMPVKLKCPPRVEEVVETREIDRVLDLPELALECILEKLSPAALASMACVCRPLRDRCRSDRLWERHMREKWSRAVGEAARGEWEEYLGLRKDSAAAEGNGDGEGLISKNWMELLCYFWPSAWFKSRVDDTGSKYRNDLQIDSVMSWYGALESGKLWFPAQVYNREQNGHIGFLLSCYDAHLSYDRKTDTFYARYPPHGQKPVKMEEGIQWDRLRASPVDTPAHDLYVSDCLNDLCPGDQFEIQWRRNKEFPYGWWYGVVGHLESCDGNDHHCRCHENDTIILEFNHYTPGSRWRQASVSRKDHQEKGNETYGFYGGIRKLCSQDEISTWRRLWPSEVFE